MSRFCISVIVLGFVVTAGARWSAQGENPRPGQKTKGKFTLSKQTTYVTGPLDKDGYIDYSAALNERLAKGVTAANNANVLLWKAFGPQTDVPAEFFKLLGIEQPPKKGDYLVTMRQHAKKNEEVEPSKKAADIINDYDDRSGRPWKATEYPHVAGWLTVNEKPLAVVSEAMNLAHYFSPLVSDKGLSGLKGTLLPGVQYCRELAVMLSGRATLRLGEGRTDAAWQDLLTCHRLGRHIARGGTLVEMIVGIAIDHIASDADVVFLEHAELDAQRLKQCLRDLQSLPPMPKLADKIELGERFMFLDSIMMIDRDGVAYLAKFGSDALPAPEAVVESVLNGIDWDPALRNANRWYDRVVGALRLGDRGARQKQLEQIERDLNALKQSLRDTQGKLLVDEKQTPGARGKLIGDRLICLFFPALRRIDQAADHTEQVHRNLHVAFALGAYEREHGSYPKTLQELAPKYLAQVPDDLFSGKALIYRLDKKGYLLYSVGPNGKDEEGRWYYDNPRGDDPRVRMPLPPRRK